MNSISKHKQIGFDFLTAYIPVNVLDINTNMDYKISEESRPQEVFGCHKMLNDFIWKYE